MVVSLDDPGFTLDPLQLFADPQVARRIALDTILPLINIPVVSGPGVLLSKFCAPEHRGRHNLRSLADVRDYLAERAHRHQPRRRGPALVRAIDAVKPPPCSGGD